MVTWCLYGTLLALALTVCAFLVVLILLSSHPDCTSNETCAECTTSRYKRAHRWPFARGPVCAWIDSACVKKETHGVLEFEYDCPLGPDPYPESPPDVLPNWVGRFRRLGLLDNVTLTDFCWPGSHDSLSYDLSLEISEDGLDEFQYLSLLLHILSAEILPGELENFFRMQAKTQQLTVLQQLDNGIRFLDLRLMYEHDRHMWYSIHFMQSRHEIQFYLRQIRFWLDRHPDELVILWLSKHGSTGATGNDAYPGVPSDIKQALWMDYVDIFGSLLCDFGQASIHETNIEYMLKHGFRVITFVSDYEEFTASSRFAMDARKIKNTWDSSGGVFHEELTLNKHLEYVRNAKSQNQLINKQGGWTLLAMNSQCQKWEIEASAEKRFLGRRLERCFPHIEIPDSQWCPSNLLDIIQLSSYYNQRVFEYARGNSCDLPNAMYLDALDYDGTVRVGTQLLDGTDRGDQAETKTARYAYVDTLLTYNLEKTHPKQEDEYQELKTLLEKRQRKYGIALWEEPILGRHSDWPAIVASTLKAS